jgi:transaldolase / glucose-6-phosphate isomerase
VTVAAPNARLAALTAAGTSVWLDQLRRGMIESGDLQRMVEEDSLRGVTSNPAIFEKAILGSPDYDEDLRRLAQEGRSAREVYRRLALEDVQMAADVLRPVYEETGGVDGYVSWEVAPRLAHDTEGTLEQAHLYWDLVQRPNLMIKIPATDEGLPAIERALYEGLNVNVTLLFSVAAYERVMEAFMAAMERRLDEGRPLDRHSVASFFVSRVDTEVDRRLEALDRRDLQGVAALANARAAYKAFKRVFEGERFARLADAGCPVQRPLWASTGVKNPRYSETMYVYGLVGPHTVNTMPLPTLTAAASSGVVTGATAGQDPTADLHSLRDAGIDLADVTDKLLREGIDAFTVPMAKLLAGVERRREAIVTGRPETIDADLPDELEQPVADRVRRAVDDDVVHRLWHRDVTLWAPPGTREVIDRLGWLDIAERTQDELAAIQTVARECRDAGHTDVLLLGMGGSSLAPEVLRRSLGDRTDDHALRLHVLDSTHPDQVRAVAEALDLEHTLFIVSSKSGGTLETISQFEYFHGLQPNGAHYFAITDPGTPLAGLARRHAFARTFLNDTEIGGRYSALSYFGLVPAALAGADVDALLDGAHVAARNCEARQPEGNFGLWLGCLLGELALQGRDKLTLIVSEPISSFGLWAEELVSESTGKQGRGILPIVDEPVASDLAAYGADRVFMYVRNKGMPDAEHERRVAELAAAGHPTVTLDAHGVEDLGRLFFTLEFATAVAGWALQVNPFDQPQLQQSKDNTARALAEPAPPVADAAAGDLRSLIEGLEPPAYLAIMGYLPYSDAIDAAVGRLRAAVRGNTGIATTFGYGPRCLHAAGQFHKGGPPTGVFLQLVQERDRDLEIPGRSYSFGRVIDAQADGDLSALAARDRKVARVRLPADDPAGAIDELVAAIGKGSG